MKDGGAPRARREAPLAFSAPPAILAPERFSARGFQPEADCGRLIVYRAGGIAPGKLETAGREAGFKTSLIFAKTALVARPVSYARGIHVFQKGDGVFAGHAEHIPHAAYIKLITLFKPRTGGL